MRVSSAIETFKDRYPLIGPTLWMLSVQYYVIQWIVALAWPVPYGVLHRTISDLGNTACQPYHGDVVCSPLHALMNVSFVVLGSTMLAGSTLIYREFTRSRTSAVGFSCMGLAGVGTLLVGLSPENTVGVLHELGAGLVFVVGNLALLVLGSTLDMPRALRYFTIISGAVALVAFLLFVTHLYLGIGIGGMERFTAYPQTVWLMVFGIYMTRNHFRPKT